MDFDTTNNKLNLHNGTTASPVVTEAHTATLTNKTLTAPVISTISNTGTLTLPTSTDTLVGRNTTDTLTNKTLTSPVINTPTGITKADVGLGNVDNTSDATKDAATATLTNKTLTAPVISTIVNTGTLTLPTSTDTLVGRATTDTLTNKTLTAPVISTIVNTGTLTLPTSTDTIVGRATTDTLTNKTLTSPVISTISNTGTLTLPTSTDTLVGRATTDTLTNKTIGDAATYTQVATPSNPASGFNKLYFKSDNILYQLTNGGTESQVSSGTLDAPSSAQNYTLTASVGSNALTIALKTKAGTDPTASDPVKVSFRNATDATGDYTTLTITSALSFVVSAGSTLGSVSGNNLSLWVYLFNDGGTPRLGASGTLFNEGIVKSSTAEGGAGAADSNRIIYTGTAVTNKAFRVIGLMKVINTTGNWTTAPSVIFLDPIKEQNAAVRYASSAGQSLTNDTLTVIDFNTREYDVMGLVSGSGTSWVYTCPADGVYFINSTLVFDNGASWSADERRFMQIKINGTQTAQYLFYHEADAAGAGRRGMTGSITMNLSAGDTIALAAQQTSGASLAIIASATFNHIDIFKLQGFGTGIL